MRLSTLGDILKRFGALQLVVVSRLLAVLTTLKLAPGEKIPEDVATEFQPLVRAALKECEISGLPMCCRSLERLHDAVEKRQNWNVLVEHAEDLNRRLADELLGRVFFQISEAARYETPLSGWEDVVVRFPDVQADVEESGRCFAVARYTASIFHLMRVLEGGLDGIAKILNPGDDWYSSWEAYLRKLNEAWRARYDDPKNPNHRKWSRFFSEVERHLYAIKIAVRNPTMHRLERTYTEESAEEIYSEVRSLMRHLAVELPP
jgi:hypothetical protein